ncbi:MAG: hypothetical protein NVS2B7_30380 [Herpetosiphon sp.]
MRIQPWRGRLGHVMIGALVVLAITACDAQKPVVQATTTIEPNTSPMATSATAQSAIPTGPTQIPTAGTGQFRNPVLDRDFPDPDILKVAETYYAYATNAGSTNIQTARSTDLVHWEMLADALPLLPSWSERGHTWAPEVAVQSAGGTFVMYFVARDSVSKRQCIGVATSAYPQGPFKSEQTNPLICQNNEGGSIDPDSFTDQDGQHYLIWKNDGNCCGQDTYIYLQKVSPDGLQLQGAPSRLIHQDQTWEGKLVEAPNIWKHGKKYYLFYSANNYAGDKYAVGYAMADSITGPYQKGDGPLLQTATDRGIVIGPGGEDVVTTSDGQTWLAYHSWDATFTYRAMNIDKLDWEGDRPVVRGPLRIPEPAPTP